MNLIHQLSEQIQKNIITTRDGKFLQAGDHQFQSFWTRDFCWASFGLVAIKEYEVVKNHLQHLLDRMNTQGLIPRILQTGRSDRTVVLNTVFRFLPRRYLISKHNRKIKAEHYGEHGTLSINSNALVILAFINYVEASGDHKFLEDNKDKLLQCFKFYKNRLDNGLVFQKEFEDWQDSAKRAGKTFYTNLLYFQACKKLSEHGVIAAKLAEIKSKIHRTFFTNGLYRSVEHLDIMSTEANYLAIIWDFLPADQGAKVYKKLAAQKFHSKEFPLCSVPTYPSHEISWTTKIVGLSRYHDHMLWSWILGLKLLAAKKLNLSSETQALENLLIELISENEFLFEIYRVNDLTPFKNPLYYSEHPFSWGLGINLWALKS